jgi:hypothetical protein
MRGKHWKGCLLFILILLSCTPLPPDTVLTWLTSPQLIATTTVGRPIAAGDYLFWLDRRGGGAIYSYQRSQGREFVVASLGMDASAAYLASDGRTVAWLDTRAVPQRIRAYHLPTGRAFAIAIPSPQPMIADLALDQGVLYYWDHALDHRGIFAASLAGGPERPQAVGGRRRRNSQDRRADRARRAVLRQADPVGGVWLPDRPAAPGRVQGDQLEYRGAGRWWATALRRAIYHKFKCSSVERIDRLQRL